MKRSGKKDELEGIRSGVPLTLMKWMVRGAVQVAVIIRLVDVEGLLWFVVRCRSDDGDQPNQA